MRAFCSKEKLTGDNAFECSRCNRKTTALQSLQITNISPVIVIHLKRFIYDRNEKITRKLKDLILYPEFLDFMPYIDNNTESQSGQENYQPDQFIYQLYAVVVHLGEAANNGHIFSYVRSSDELWYKINDELVTPVNIETVLSDKNSYILYYAKLSGKKLVYIEQKLMNFLHGHHVYHPQRLYAVLEKQVIILIIVRQ